MIRISGRCPSFLLLFAGLFSIAGLVPPAGAQIEKWMPQEPDADYRHASPAAIEAWKDRKFGMRIHWGVYSVLGIEASWPMIVVDATSDFRQLYSTLYEVFNPTDFDAEEWAALAQRAGMTYFVITTKHHDGFSMWDTRTKVRALRRRPGSDAVDPWYISYSIMDTPYRKDIVGALAQAFHKRGLGVGFYYSHIDWNDPDFRWDKFSPLYDPDYTKESDPEAWARFINREREQLRELCSNYGPLEELSLDMGWPEAAWPDMVRIVKMMRELQPDVLMRWRGVGPYGDFDTPEGWVPYSPSDTRISKPWESIVQLGSWWAYGPNSVYKPKEWLVSTLVDVVAKGGNLMLGVGPMANGRFPPEAVARLEYAGAWLRVNGEAIFKTRPWNVFQEGEDVRFTRSKDGKYVYAISLKWPGEKLLLRSVRALKGSTITMLGIKASLKWHQDKDGLVIEIPPAIARNRPCEKAYAFKIAAAPYKKRYERI